MSAVRARLRAELRARWRAWGTLALLIGLAGGVVLAVATGARRTQTAYTRFLRESKAADVLLSPAQTGLPSFYDAVARLPGVAAIGPFAGMHLALLEPSGEPNLDIAVYAPTDGRLGVTVNEPKLLAGRLGGTQRADEVVVNRGLAKSHHLQVGGRLRALAYTEDEEGEVSNVRPMTMKVVGIAVFPDDVVAITRLSAIPRVILTPAYFRARGPAEIAAAGGLNYDGAYVRLDPDASVATFRRGVEALRPEHPELGDTLFVSNEGDQAAKVEDAIRPQAVALGLFALLAGVAVILVVGQLLGRQIFLDSGEHPTLSALGMSRRQLFWLALARVGATTLVGATVAVVVAAVTSPHTPIGPARLAEPHPGFHMNTAMLAAGFAGIVVLLLGRAAVPAWRAASRRGAGAAERAASETPSRLGEAATRAGLPPSIAVGVRMALEPGRGRTAVPVRGAVIGTALAVAAVTAALTFGENLVRLVDTPALYGQNWDVAVDGQFGGFPAKDATAVVTGNRDVAAYAGGTYGELTIMGRAVAAVGIDRLRGEALPTLLDGHWPMEPDEIALGTKVLRRLHRSVGDNVAVDAGDGSRTLRIVGRAVFPAFGRGSFTPTGLGEGAAVTAASLFQPTTEAPDPSYNFFLVQFRAGVDRAAATARLTRAVRAAGCDEGQCQIVTAQRPREINDYERVRGTPLILATVLAALAVATVIHLLISSVQRRRRDLAVLKTLGFVRLQVSATVAWQATTLAALAVLFGLPLGVASGRWVWAVFARQLGVSTVTVVPVSTVLLAVPITILIANLAAAGPGWIAGRLRPATVLRTG